MRIKKGLTAHHKHLKIRRATKGMQHGRRRSYRLGKQAVTRALQYATRDRHNRKRTIRSLWITRINNASRQNNTTYRQLMADLKKNNIELDRKTLSELAVRHSTVFKSLAEKVSPKK